MRDTETARSIFTHALPQREQEVGRVFMLEQQIYPVNVDPGISALFTVFNNSIEDRVKKPVLEMGSIKFRCDGEFSALAVVNRIQIFLNKGGKDLTIRGIGEHGREYSSIGVGKKLLEWLRLLEVGMDPLDILKKVQKFRTELIEHTAPQDMYRSLRTGLMTLTGTPSRFSRVRLDLPFDDPAWEALLDPTETLVDIVIPFGNLLIDKSRVS